LLSMKHPGLLEAWHEVKSQVENNQESAR
jgi:hypothetical protein